MSAKFWIAFWAGQVGLLGTNALLVQIIAFPAEGVTPDQILVRYLLLAGTVTAMAVSLLWVSEPIVKSSWAQIAALLELAAFCFMGLPLSPNWVAAALLIVCGAFLVIRATFIFWDEIRRKKVYDE